MDLENCKTLIEQMPKSHQIEILKIIKDGEPTNINSNKSGVFVNMSTLSVPVLEKIAKYVEYVQTQEKSLSTVEQQKDDFKHSYFDNNLKQDKENTMSMYSYQG